MHRLFAALRPPASIRHRLLAAMGGIAGARWQSDDQLHLTLRFIGEVDRRTAEDGAAALDTIHAEPVAIRLAGVGHFAHRGRVEALWAAMTPHDALARLHRKVDQACVRAGLVPERRAYLPHVTLARIPRSRGDDPAIGRWLAEHGSLASEPFAPARLILYESRLGGDGASYEPVACWPLGAGIAGPGS